MSHHPTPGAVRLQRFTRSFGGKNVLDAIDLDIAPGQFVALLGESGSGKTTLLRALAGLDGYAQSSGAASAQGNVSVLFQDARLLPWLSVLDNLTLGLDARAVLPASTTPNHAAMMTGVSPQRSGIVDNVILGPQGTPELQNSPAMFEQDHLFTRIETERSCVQTASILSVKAISARSTGSTIRNSSASRNTAGGT